MMAIVGVLDLIFSKLVLWVFGGSPEPSSRGRRPEAPLSTPPEGSHRIVSEMVPYDRLVESPETPSTAPDRPSTSIEVVEVAEVDAHGETDAASRCVAEDDSRPLSRACRRQRPSDGSDGRVASRARSSTRSRSSGAS